VARFGLLELARHRLGSALTLRAFSTVLIEASDQVEDSVLRYLRTDGREVRPGGRRKR
jgi:hypothetical protein